MNKLVLIIALVALALGAFAHADDTFPFKSLDKQPLINPYVIVALCEAHDCPPNFSPPGSYKNSCRSCTVTNGHYMTCRCDHNDTSIDLATCPAGEFCNNHGNLQCGGC